MRRSQTAILATALVELGGAGAPRQLPGVQCCLSSGHRPQHAQLRIYGPQLVGIEALSWPRGSGVVGHLS